MSLGPVVGVRVEPLAGEEQRLAGCDRSWPARSAALGSSFLIARIAVGAVNSAFTPCSAMTRQNALGVRRADRLALVEHGRGARRAAARRRCRSGRRPSRRRWPPRTRRPGRCRRRCACSRPARRHDRRCRARCPWACPWCRTCRARRAGRWRRPATHADRLGRRDELVPVEVALAHRGERLRALQDHARRPARARPARAPGRASACTRRRVRARCRTTPRRRPSASRRRCGSPARAGANPPNTTECTAPSARAGQHRDDGLGNHRHVDHDPVAGRDAEAAQRAREPRHLVAQPRVGEGVRRPGHRAVVDQRGPVAVAGLDVAVERVGAGVEPAAGEPAVERRVRLVEHRGRLDVPVDRRGLRPERDGILRLRACAAA